MNKNTFLKKQRTKVSRRAIYESLESSIE